MTENLQEVFNQIAPSWYNYRHHTIFRQELESLASQWQNGKLLNLGCGHGADFLPFTDKFELYGIDFSAEMVARARKYAKKYNFVPNLAIGDISHLPYANASFDFAISVATYHHLTANDRQPALVELKRVLKPGGYAFITVWNRWQLKFWFRGNEILIPWKMKEKTLYRYYHPFSYGEIKKLAQAAGFQVVKEFAENRFRFPLKYFSRNICLIVKKT